MNSATSYAQSAGDYMATITKEFQEIAADGWDYTSAVAHGKSARKVENRRKEVLAANTDAQEKIKKMGAFEGDKSLRDSTLAFLKLSYHVINFDYGKIVDMEAISEESYDAMDAYLTAQEKAGEKLKEAGKRIEAEQKKFAAAHNIKLINSEDKLSAKLEEADKVFSYYNRVYLIFFKSYKEEGYVLDALNKHNINIAKGHADSLGKYSTHGLKYLDTVQAFKGDNTLKTACVTLLTFYKSEATDKASVLLNFSAKEEGFYKIKAAFDSKPKNSRTQADVDEYNKAVNDFNEATNEYNALNQQLNAKRAEFLNQWNEIVSNFLDKQVPKRK
ncbi:MAG TPA: hypothetical protein VE978_18105 [Chitinophagales bacterium]|nr:hypothetical protein [Chitinophagales bacterium]